MIHIELSNRQVNFPVQLQADVFTEPGVIPAGSINVRIYNVVTSEGFNPRCTLHLISKIGTYCFGFNSYAHQTSFYLMDYTHYGISIHPSPTGDQSVSFDLEFECTESMRLSSQ